MKQPLIRAEIDLGAIAHNLSVLRSLTQPQAKIMAVVKANAYGHGSIKIAQTVLSKGADSLGVARIEEGLLLRKNGISAPILVFGHVPSDEMKLLIEYDLTATVYSIQVAESLSRTAVSMGNPVRIHVKVDTGMGRLGLLPDFRRFPEKADANLHTLVSEIENISKLPGLIFEGIYTHFATSDQFDRSFSAEQLSLFIEMIELLRKRRIDVPVRHSANSAAVISMPESHMDLVRPGIAIYGLYPSDEMDRKQAALIPAMSLKTHIMLLKKVPAHFKVSYGGVQETLNPSVIATVPIGYADGFNRANSFKGSMLVRGQPAPIIGRVCMDLTMLDVGHIPDVSLNDEVVVFGKQHGGSRTSEDLARDLGTISYEIVTSVSNRVPRIYTHGSQESE